MQFLEQHAVPQAQTYRGKKQYSTESAAMIAIVSSKIKMATMAEVAKHTDMKLRRGKHEWWEGIKGLAEIMGGRTGLIGKQ